MLADVIQTEEDLNNDYIQGWEPGTTAENRRIKAAKEVAAKAEREMWQAGDVERFRAVYGDARVLAWEDWQRRQEKANADFKLYMEGKWSETYGNGYKARKSRATGGGYRYRAKTAAEERAELPSYGQGRAKGDTIGLDKQVNKDRRDALPDA